MSDQGINLLAITYRFLQVHLQSRQPAHNAFEFFHLVIISKFKSSTVRDTLLLFYHKALLIACHDSVNDWKRRQLHFAFVLVIVDFSEPIQVKASDNDPSIVKFVEVTPSLCDISVVVDFTKLIKSSFLSFDFDFVLSRDQVQSTLRLVHHVNHLFFLLLKRNKVLYNFVLLNSLFLADNFLGVRDEFVSQSFFLFQRLSFLSAVIYKSLSFPIVKAAISPDSVLSLSLLVNFIIQLKPLVKVKWLVIPA